MLNKNKHLTERPAWHALCQHYKDIAPMHMRDWFAADNQRNIAFSLRVGDITFDFSRHRITKQTIGLLCDLASAVDLQRHIQALFSGDRINISENRAALHTALRDKSSMTEIHDARAKLYDFVTRVHNGSYKGITGKQIKHVINIGIGGSCLGPKMAIHALKDAAINDLKFYFVSTVDKTQLQDVLNDIDPETALFIISSKTFTTIETITNANTVRDWMQQKLGKDALSRHFVAITAANDKALAYGIQQDHVFPIWDWVGGRYSVWSAISLPLILMIGAQQFDAFLEGAYAVDTHFRTMPFHANIPVIMALLTIWYVNFFHTRAHAVVPYAHRLRYLVNYLQQVEMESNGKSISRHGTPIDYVTCPVIFGEEGCDGQHAYHQLLHQGQHLIPVDFILIGSKKQSADVHHNIMTASCLSQAQALMQGKTQAEAYAELLQSGLSENDARLLAPHKVIPGNRPSSILHLAQLNPHNLGALLALYEHSIFVTGIIWDINSFDQWGVELGKQLLPGILESMR